MGVSYRGQAQKIRGAAVAVVVALSSGCAEDELAESFGQEVEPYVDDVPNPDRGFTTRCDISTEDCETITRLVHAAVPLPRSSLPLPESPPEGVEGEFSLAGLEAGFDNLRANGQTVVLRFSYGGESLGYDELGTEPEGATEPDLAAIENHISSLAGKIGDNADIVTVVEAGFLGKWGEWHGSSMADDAATRIEVLRLLFEHIPEELPILVRKPHFKVEALQFCDRELESRFSCAAVQRRLGFHNDCFLSDGEDGDDRGTYFGDVEGWKNHMATWTETVPMGGETCGLPDDLDCSTLEHNLARFHWSYLNRQGIEDVLQRCPEIGPRLGYRLEVVAAEIPDEAERGGTLPVSATLFNGGFAAPIRSRPVYFLLSQEPEEVVVLKHRVEGADPTGWLPGDSTTLSASIDLPQNLPCGEYSVSLWLSPYSPRIAGADDGGGHNVVGRVKICP